MSLLLISLALECQLYPKVGHCLRQGLSEPYVKWATGPGWKGEVCGLNLPTRQPRISQEQLSELGSSAFLAANTQQLGVVGQLGQPRGSRWGINSTHHRLLRYLEVLGKPNLFLLDTFCSLITWSPGLGGGALGVTFCACSQSCPALCNPVDCSPPGSSVYGIFQARILEWVAISSSKASWWPRDWTHVSCFSCIGRRSLYHWAIWKHTRTHLHVILWNEISNKHRM